MVPGGRCSSDDTTVLAHLPVWGKGMSTKVTDMAGAYACSNCHDLIDGRNATGKSFILEYYPAAAAERMLHGLTETHAMMVEDGIILIPDADLI